MDPEECLQRIIDAYRDENNPELTEAFVDLWEWLARGGFAPSNRKLVEAEISEISTENHMFKLSTPSLGNTSHLFVVISPNGQCLFESRFDPKS